MTFPSPLRLGIDPDLATHERLVDLIGPLLVPRKPPQWVHRPHGLAVAEKYAAEAPRRFVLTEDIAACDVAVLPISWEHVLLDPTLGEVGRRFCRTAADAGKVVLVFVDGDDHVDSPGPNAVVLRTSLDRHRRNERDVALPAWIRDPGVQEPSPMRERPVVSFCGQAYPLDLRRTDVAKRAKFYGRVALTRLGIIGRLGKHAAFPERARAVRALAGADGLDARIILRSATTRLDLDTEAEHRLHAEYIESLADSDYVLAVRGLGNYSFRLYEAMAAGRVPLYVDTDGVLPLESAIPWSDLCVVVPARDIRNLGPITTAAHAARGSDLSGRQAACRVAWERRLSMEGYFRTLHEQVATLLAAGSPLTAEAVAASLR
jgi:hypothetical protein